MLATASFDASTAVWTERGGDWECVAVVEGHENEVKSCAFSPSGSLLATCGRDKTVWIWECQPGFDFECVAVLHGHTQDVKQVKWHPTEDVLVSVSYDNDVRVWEEDPDGDDWSCARVVSEKEGGHGSTVWSAAFEARARGNHATGDLRMATCSDDRNIVVWDAKGADRGGQRAFFGRVVFLFFFPFRFSVSIRRATCATKKTNFFGRWSDGRVGRAPDAPGSTYLPARSNCGLGSSSRQNCNRGVTYLWTSRIFAGDTGDVQNAFRSSRSAEGGSFSLLAISSAHLFLLSPPTRAFPRSKKKTNAPKQPARPAWPSRRQPRSRAATTARRFRSPGGPRGSSRRAAATTACDATAPAARRRRGGKSARRRRRTPTT